MGRIRRNIEDAVNTRLFQFVGICFWITAKSSTAVAAEFSAAVANEYQFYLLFEIRCIIDIIQGDATTAEEPDV